MVKRHTWSDIKARTTPEVCARIEAQTRLLSEDISLARPEGAQHPEPEGKADAFGNVPDKHSDWS